MCSSDLTENPVPKVGHVKNEKTTMRFWTKEEFEKAIVLLDRADYYEHYLFICLWLLFMTGMRFGEATAIQWEDIDFETRLLKINKTLHFKSQEDYSFSEPKTKASKRNIALDETTLQFLKAWKKEQQKLVQTGTVLSYRETPTQNHDIARTLKKLAMKAGVSSIHIHGLRHYGELYKMVSVW